MGRLETLPPTPKMTPKAARVVAGSSAETRADSVGGATT